MVMDFVAKTDDFSFCRKAFPGSQRGPYGITTGLLLRCNGSPVATPGGPYGTAGLFGSGFGGCFVGKNGRSAVLFCDFRKC